MLDDRPKTPTVPPTIHSLHVSVASSGAEVNDDSAGASISGDGRFVAFDSRATDLVSDDNNGQAFCHKVCLSQRARASTLQARIGGRIGLFS